LKVIDVELNDVNGGSFSVTAAHSDSKYHGKSAAVSQLLRAEEAAGLSGLEPYRVFSEGAKASRAVLKSFVAQAKKEGKRICGLGASTKGNVILQYCGFSAADIEVIADVNSDKHGVLTPGTWIPIEAEDKVLASNPDYLLVLPWHFREFFLKSPLFKGRRLVFPLPSLEVVVPQ
jgi:NDP-4-keto-2,6-dideoxyhexose 3-C-methyltransferase